MTTILLAERGRFLTEVLCTLVRVSSNVTHFRLNPEDYRHLSNLQEGVLSPTSKRFLGTVNLVVDPKVQEGYVVLGLGSEEILAECQPIWDLLHEIPRTRFQRVDADILGEEPLDPALQILAERFSGCAPRRSMSLELPPNVGQDREQAIRDYVRNGTYEVNWAKVVSTHAGHTGEFWVFADALKIEGVRVNVSAETEQIIADLLGCVLLTPKLADLIWMQRAVTLPPFPRPITATTQAMVEHSAKIDAALLKLDYKEGIVATVGKHWVLDNDLLVKTGRAMNYGWHFEGASFQGIKGEPVATLMKDDKGQYMRLIQGRGTAHDMHHADYSQICVLASRECIIDGQPMDILTLLQDPALAPMISHQGALKLTRQPGVPKEKALVLPEGIIDDA